jgi:hypothetical protein
MLMAMNEHARPLPRQVDLVENVRREQLDWVKATLEYHQWNPTRLAREAGISQSTLSKFINDPSNMARLETNSVEKLKRVSPFPPYQTVLQPTARGFAEHEAEPFDEHAADQDPYVERAVAAISNGRNGIAPWSLRSRALETAGYLPGDVLLVDLNAKPQDGDAVGAQVYDRAGNAETVFRIYEAPYLQAATYQRGLFKPLLIDGDRVVVRGVVVTSIRPRLSLLAS